MQSPAVVLVGSLVAALVALVFVWIYSSAGAKTQVLVVRDHVAAGQTIHQSDLATTAVSATGSVSGIAASNINQVVGHVASEALAPGTLLNRSEVGTGNQATAGQSIVGLAMKPGTYPSSLEPGDTVDVVLTPGNNASTLPVTGSQAILAQGAMVTAVAGAENSAQNTLVSVQLPAAQTVAVTQANAQGSLSLVIVGG